MTAAETPGVPSASPDGVARDVLIREVLDFLAGHDLLTLDEVRVAIEREVDGAGPGALPALEARLAADHGWGYYPPNPLARRIHHVLAGRFLAADSIVRGSGHLAHTGDRPLVIFANHLSYADANVVEVLLTRAGAASLASRLTAVAGPKVFTDRRRRFSSLCFGTIKVPQSADVASGEAVLSPREVAIAARQSIEAARARLDAGDALLLFAEGTRSRTGGMQPMLHGVTRYLAVPGLWILPFGLTGPEALFPIDDVTVRAARIVMSVGPAIAADALFAAADGDRRVAIDAIGLAVAEQLPGAYRGSYGDPGAYAQAATALARARAAALAD